jgi:hypothetical protein
MKPFIAKSVLNVSIRRGIILEQREKCDTCIWRDNDDNCIKIKGCLGSKTPCNYIKKCEIYKPKKL